jgi:CheY-like chemotaxis protein
MELEAGRGFFCFGTGECACFVVNCKEVFGAWVPAVNAAPPENMSRKRILIADDEEAIRMIVRMTLEDLYEFGEAADGDEAWRVFENASPPFDLVIMDLNMPVLDGNELLERVRLKDPKIGVILLTGRLDYQPRQPSPRIRVIRKPFDNAELAETVSQLLAS